ncbi:MAG TPA: amidohydrolase family protein [Pseudonocardia sp.]
MSRFDTIITGGTLIDGRNFPRRRADVGITDGRVTAIATHLSSADADEVIDATGLIVAPGFVDLHTHYDAQLFWDPYCTLSGWHGVTSVAIGNCGFGFAPAKPTDQDYLMRSLTRVEAIPYECIQSSLNWSWESFPEWMDEIDRRPKGLNMLTYVPLNPLLIYVMGLEGAKAGREPTEPELVELTRLLDEAMEAGACGWSAQRSQPGSGVDMQRDWDGTHFATDLMSHKTAMALAKVLAKHEHAFVQTLLFGPDPAQTFAEMEELAEASNSAILFNTVATDERQPEAHKQILAWIRSCQERSLKIYAQCLTTAQPFFFTFENWNLFDDSDAWRDALMGSTEERLAKFADPARRAALKSDMPRSFDINRMIVLKTMSDRFLPAKGMMLRDGIRMIEGYDDPVDLLVDMVVADGLKTLFQLDNFNSSPELQADLVTSQYGVWGVSDGGAHTKFITHGAFPTESIVNFVRERNLVTLEEAHWRLSALPAHLAGFSDRGTIVEGAPADIIVYDYENLTLLDEETEYDLPAGEWRLTRRAEGYRYTLVNGTTTFVDGKATGATPGKLLRHGTA